MQDNSYMCNALIPGRQAIAWLRVFTMFAGNWIRGTVRLEDDQLVFSTNALNALHQENASDFALAFSEISSATLGRLAGFLKTVDLETPRGTVRLRCLIASNERLLAEVRKRI